MDAYLESFSVDLDSALACPRNRDDRRVLAAEAFRRGALRCGAALRSSETAGFEVSTTAALLVQKLVSELEAEGVADFMSVAPLALACHPLWDPVSLAGFLCWVELMCLAGRAWTRGSGERTEFSAQIAAELRDVRARPFSELRAEVMAAAGVSECPLAEMAYRVAFESSPGTLDEAEFSQADAQTRLNRRGIRLFERAFVLDGCRRAVDELLEGLATAAHELDPARDASADDVEAWFRKSVADANNALLLRMDEWAALNLLSPLQTYLAGGERGGCPEEHRANPAMWVARRCRDANGFAEFARVAKMNEEHEVNVFLAFSNALSQNFDYDWLTMCFVCAVNVVGARRKLAAFVGEGGRRKPPVVVQRKDVLWVCHEDSSGGRKIRCGTAAEAVAVWLSAVRVFCPGGEYARRRRAADVVDLIHQRVNAVGGGAREREECASGGAAADVRL